jgi:hypothetical protein
MAMKHKLFTATQSTLAYVVQEFTDELPAGTRVTHSLSPASGDMAGLYALFLTWEEPDDGALWPAAGQDPRYASLVDYGQPGPR